MEDASEISIIFLVGHYLVHTPLPSANEAKSVVAALSTIST